MEDRQLSIMMVIVWEIVARSIERVIEISLQAVEPVLTVTVELDLPLCRIVTGSHRLCSSPVTKAVQSRNSESGYRGLHPAQPLQRSPVEGFPCRPAAAKGRQTMHWID